ncbi:molecular chaperone [Pseudomonas sp. PDNC002]|uniref:fimbrial biogenesis chaperone n=1 Tax=Pseudomonas sp. PDNC002 TaxID=2811422 RepID=UPI001962F92C|nr:molecular chaperone [Pseudomonas sp. PDNC002]QRY77845.1 molecular chaperone [Pseudomonas sp. PDNC002]
MCSRQLNRALTRLLCLWLALAAGTVRAGVTAESTRVIFASNLNEVAVLLANVNPYPVMVQTWIDDGALDSTPDKAISPFMSLPSVFRLEPGERRSLRIIFTGKQSLPRDRESVFWLNLHEVPPSSVAAGMPAEQQRLVVSMHTQMKVFYRPTKLTMTQPEAAAKLTASWQQNGEKTQLRIDNPSPYFMTLTAVELIAGQQHQSLKGDMVKPESSLVLEAAGHLPGGPVQVEFTWLDDDGNPQKTRATLH